MNALNIARYISVSAFAIFAFGKALNILDVSWWWVSLIWILGITFTIGYSCGRKNL